MQSHERTRNALLAGIAAGLVGACDIISPEPATVGGTLVVTISTIGHDVAPNGYAVSVMGLEVAENVSVNGQAVFRDVPVGVHTVELLHLEANCVTQEQNPHQITVVEGETTSTAFQVTCSHAGTVKVLIETCGSNIDPDGYTVWLDGEEMNEVSVDDDRDYPVSPGTHEVWLTGVADNCTVYGLMPATSYVGWMSIDTAFVGVYCDADEESKIAYTATHGLFLPWAASSSYVQVISTNGRCRATLTSGDYRDTSPLWSPDGTRLAFERGGPLNPDHRGICVMNADGSGRSCVADVQDVEFFDVLGFDWSPDGTRIAFGGFTQRYATREIFVVSRDGSGLVNLTNSSGTVTPQEPTWSPDGSRIAYTAYIGDQAEIYVIGANGTDVTNLTNHQADDASPAWSPDGSKLAFWSWRDDLMGLYVMDMDGSNPTKPASPTMVGVSVFTGPPVWSPVGSQLAVSYIDDTGAHIYVVNSDGLGLRTLVAGQGPAWSPDGTRIVFTASDLGIAVINADGTGLVEFGVPGFGAAWSR
ncbi:hypothetical protein ACFL3B_03695 [Gemmatimonadota bacterium]